jgi:hypothetical protein
MHASSRHLAAQIIAATLKNAKTIEKSASKFAIKHAGVLAWKTLLARGGDVMYWIGMQMKENGAEHR